MSVEADTYGISNTPYERGLQCKTTRTSAQETVGTEMSTLEILKRTLVMDTQLNDWEILSFCFDESGQSVNLIKQGGREVWNPSLRELIDIENNLEAAGELRSQDRVTCPVCLWWNLEDHEENWLLGLEDHAQAIIDEVDIRQALEAVA